jgi:hypothetical protein
VFSFPNDENVEDMTSLLFEVLKIKKLPSYNCSRVSTVKNINSNKQISIWVIFIVVALSEFVSIISKL